MEPLRIKIYVPACHVVDHQEASCISARYARFRLGLNLAADLVSDKFLEMSMRDPWSMSRLRRRAQFEPSVQ